MRSFREFHSPEFDEDIQLARNFVQRFGSPVQPVPIEKITIVPTDREEEFLDFYNQEFLGEMPDAYRENNLRPNGFKALYFPDNSGVGINANSIVQLDKPYPLQPKTALMNRLCTTVHELTHSLTYPHETGRSQGGNLYAEVLAGLGELAFLRHIDRINGRSIPGSTSVWVGAGERHQITVAGNLRCLDGSESLGELFEEPCISNGALGAYALQKALEACGVPLTSEKIIRFSEPNSAKGINLLRQCLARLEPELPELLDGCLGDTYYDHLEASRFILQYADERLVS